MKGRQSHDNPVNVPIAALTSVMRALEAAKSAYEGHAPEFPKWGEPEEMTLAMDGLVTVERMCHFILPALLMLRDRADMFHADRANKGKEA
ncbi:MAG: hypothetical protein IJJ33_11415 [Victivallales bacterium]|nr:hypothetical protein [Victivallales bacterium]